MLAPSINIPNPIPDTKAILSALNPATWIKDVADWVNGQITSLFNEVMNYVTSSLTNVSNPLGGSGWDFLNQNVLNLAGILAFLVAVFITGLTMFKMHRIRSIPHALLVVVGISSFGAGWFGFCAWMFQAGNEITKGVDSFVKLAPGGGGSSQNILAAPTIDNPIGAFFGLGGIMSLAVANLLVVVFIYQIVAILVTYLGLLAIALSALGERSQKFMDFVIVALGGTSFLFGRALSSLSIGVARDIANAQANSGGWIAETFWDGGGLLLGILLQAGLVVLLYKSHIASRITGGALIAQVWGNVTSQLRGRPKVDVGKVNEAHIRSKQAPIPVKLAKPPLPERAAKALGHEAALAGATALGVKVAAGSNPLTATALHVSKRVYQHIPPGMKPTGRKGGSQ